MRARVIWSPDRVKYYNDNKSASIEPMYTRPIGGIRVVYTCLHVVRIPTYIYIYIITLLYYTIRIIGTIHLVV